MAAKPSQIPFSMGDNIRILSTALLDDALISKAAAQHISIEVRPFIKINKLYTDELAKHIATLALQQITVAFTSANAVDAVAEMLHKNAAMPKWKMYSLSGATFSCVKKYWNGNVDFAVENSNELAQQIVADKINELTFFCGNIRREELPALLHEKGVNLNEVIVYETIETPIKLKAIYDGILFFSPSAVNSFFSCNNVLAETTLFAIGNTTANAIRQFSSNGILISEHPAKEKLLEMAIEKFKR